MHFIQPAVIRRSGMGDIVLICHYIREGKWAEGI